MRTLFTGMAVAALLLAVSLQEPAAPPGDPAGMVTGPTLSAPLLVQDTAFGAPIAFQVDVDHDVQAAPATATLAVATQHAAELDGPLRSPRAVSTTSYAMSTLRARDRP